METEDWRERLQRFKSLGEGWDTYGGAAIDHALVDRARAFAERVISALPAAADVWPLPHPNGGAILAWRWGDEVEGVNIEFCPEVPPSCWGHTRPDLSDWWDSDPANDDEALVLIVTKLRAREAVL